ncbi:hypothetical protein [Amycolatopsis sp. lyj-23]|uniref:hypothetical protein n=1 Tax=Amycolatopsis sp. lyj-23 TaxID=2789283 RepID=UPI003977F081
MTGPEELEPIPSHRPGHVLLGCALVLGAAAAIVALALLTVLVAAGPPTDTTTPSSSTTAAPPSPTDHTRGHRGAP